MRGYTSHRVSTVGITGTSCGRADDEPPLYGRFLSPLCVSRAAHSWFGNLVTNATWSDFFLNEGFTM